jgi:hypothetical protein
MLYLLRGVQHFSRGEAVCSQLMRMHAAISTNNFSISETKSIVKTV